MPKISLSANEAFVCEMSIGNGPCKEIFLDHFTKEHVRESTDIYFNLTGINPWDQECVGENIEVRIEGLERCAGDGWDYHGKILLTGNVKELRVVGHYNTHSRRGTLFVVTTREEALKMHFPEQVITKAFPN